MARKTRSPWEFGELFPPEETRRVLSVSELTLQLKRLLAAQFSLLWVSGEISNLRRQASGHCYFTLKDAGAQLACVLFRGETRAGRDLLADGRKVLLQGELAIYEPRGQYQLVVKAVEAMGLGALQTAFERLKQKLLAEGLFAAERKRPLPPCPERIGIVTSPTGAALRDVLHVVKRRQPSLEMVLVPCLVQGEGAAAAIAEAIRLLNRVNVQASRATASEGGMACRGGSWLSLILVTRGGGSLEDLWAFNEEPVARAIFESALPVVSAVGHEIDVTIADFVADVRAATPSAAAEIITQDAFAAREFVRDAAALLPRLAREGCEDWRQSLAHLQHRILRAHPRRLVNQGWQHLDELLGAMPRAARLRMRALRTTWMAAQAAWLRVHPARQVQSCRAELERVRARLLEVARRRLEGDRQTLVSLLDRLRLLSPEQTLARGYSITTDARTGRVVRSAREVRSGQRLRTRVGDGDFESQVR